MKYFSGLKKALSQLISQILKTATQLLAIQCYVWRKTQHLKAFKHPDKPVERAT